MTHGVNATSVFTVSVSDTNDHFLPDTTAADTEGYDVRSRDRATVIIVNDQDQDATVQLQGAAFDDPDFDDPVDVGSSDTAAASGGTASLAIPVNEVYAYLRVKVTFATAPTGTNSVTAKYHTDSSG